jgi:putative peptidoglycan lipid II flippase
MSDQTTSSGGQPSAPTPQLAVPAPGPEGSASTSRLISASAVMAAGTMVSRVMGFGRLMLLVLLFGNGTRQAEMFTLANTVPNSMYILLAGGVLNTVLVPQIVRAIKSDPDRGEAYTNRILTAGLIVLGVITIALTLAVPLVISLYSASGWKSAALAPQYESMTMLAYYCMPQIFFYGVYVLAGQVLNARDKFGPMMWAPIANNVVSIVVLVMFLVAFGKDNPSQAFTSGEELLLGLGSTLGIAVQAGVLIPFLKAAGYRFRPRFDFKNTGLGKTFRLAKWTLGFVLVTQAALVVVNRLASGATVGGRGAGLAAYYNAYAVWVLPHSLITVSLATAMLPAASRLAAAGDLAGVRDEVTRSMRLAVTALLPAAVAFIALGLPIARLAFGFGQGAKDADFVGWALMALAVGLVPFTVQYICLRAFYSLEDTRSTFFLQIIISGANVALGITVVLLLDRPSLVATGLAVAYSVAYLVGVTVSFTWLRHKLPGLSMRKLGRHCVRLLLAAAPAGAVGFWITFGFSWWSQTQLARALALVVAGIVAVGIFLLLSRWLHIREVTEIIATLFRRRGASPAATTAATEMPLAAPITGVPAAGLPAAGVPVPGGIGPVGPPSPGDSTVLNQAPSPTIDYTTQSTPANSAPATTENAEPTVTQAPPLPPLPVASTLPAGTVLAGRYRLEEHLAEAPRTVTWRAFDQVLSRSVLVHLLAPDDPYASELLAIARKASVATDSRFLRVLDVVSSDGPIGSYIVCEYAIGQSMEAILTHGPLSGLEAGWVVREIADALAGVHTAGLYHERINPDTVIITPTGNVKIVGLLIEKALRPTANGDPSTQGVHGADSPEHIDVCDLGRLLYASLVARWPGGPAFSLPDAPVQGHRWMTPRQVRAGVAPALDNVCDQILGDPPRHHSELITTAGGVVNALTKVLGTADASGDLERRLRQPVPRVREGADSGPSTVVSTPTSRDRPVMAKAAAQPGPSAVRAPTHDPALATMIRQPAPPTKKQPRPTRPPRPPRSGAPRRWIVLVVALAMVLIAAGVASAIVLNNRVNAGPGGQSQSPGAGPTTAAVPAKLTIAGARDFDPQASPKSESPKQVKFAIDGNPTTEWKTVTYFSANLGNLKRGVGLVIDLGQPQPVRVVAVSLSGNGTNFDLRVPKANPAQTTTPPMSSDQSWQVVGAKAQATGTTTVALAAPVTTQFVLVYLTSLPKEGNGYRGGIFEVEVSS